MGGLLLASPLREAVAQESFSPTRWSMDAGYARRLWETGGLSGEQREYLDGARNGPVFGAEIAVFPHSLYPQFGVGVLYAQFQTGISDPDIEFGDGSRGSTRDHYRITYAAPALYYRRDLEQGGRRWSALGQIGPGYFYYQNRHIAGDFPGILQGHALGFHAAASADYRLLPRLGVGLGLRLVHGDLDRVRYNGISISVPPISLTRIDLTAGVRFYP